MWNLFSKKPTSFGELEKNIFKIWHKKIRSAEMKPINSELWWSPQSSTRYFPRFELYFRILTGEKNFLTNNSFKIIIIILKKKMMKFGMQIWGFLILSRINPKKNFLPIPSIKESWIVCFWFFWTKKIFAAEFKNQNDIFAYLVQLKSIFTKKGRKKDWNVFWFKILRKNVCYTWGSCWIKAK